MRYLVGTWLAEAPKAEDTRRKASETTLVSHKHPSRPSIVHFKEGIRDSPVNSASGRLSPTPSKTRSLGGFTTRMKLFREVMRNEVCNIIFPSCINLLMHHTAGSYGFDYFVKRDRDNYCFSGSIETPSWYFISLFFGDLLYVGSKKSSSFY